jgi:hypothetical protein
LQFDEIKSNLKSDRIEQSHNTTPGMSERVVNCLEQAIAVFNTKALLKLEKMRQDQMELNANFIV